MGNLKVAGLDIGSHNLTIDESSGTLLVDGEEVSGSGGGGISYVWIDEAAKLAQTGMSADEQGVQEDTNTVYKYDGTAWEEYYVMSDSTVQKYYEGTSAPINSKLGDEWFDQNDGTLYKKVSDGTDSVWMAINNPIGGGSGGDVDLSNYYTKLQVDGFINEINLEIGSSVTLGEYGLRWNQETDVYEALGSANRRQIQGNMKRCVLNDDGTVNYYLNPTNSVQKEQGGTAVLTGADGNVMVEVPKFWYKHTLVGDTHEWWVSNAPLAGYSVHHWFLEGGVERPFRYYRAYTPTNVAGKLRSISGSTPTRNQTRSTFRTQARANGTGWELCSWNAVNAIQLLFLTEYCTFNTQAILGRGNDTGTDAGITTGQSNSIGNASSGATNNDTWMSYRGIENWYADCWEFIDGINIQNYKVFLNQNPTTFADDVFTGDYVDSGITLPTNMQDTYFKKITGNFLPTAVGGSSSTFITDIGWSSSTGKLIIFGGSAEQGLGRSGGFAFSAYSSVGETYANLSAGLSR